MANPKNKVKDLFLNIQGSSPGNKVSITIDNSRCFARLAETIALVVDKIDVVDKYRYG